VKNIRRIRKSMTLKQLTQRFGADVKQLDFELDGPCKNCKKAGGINAPCDDECIIVAVISIQEKK
jgi:hypothetical protein